MQILIFFTLCLKGKWRLKQTNKNKWKRKTEKNIHLYNAYHNIINKEWRVFSSHCSLLTKSTVSFKHVDDFLNPWIARFLQTVNFGHVVNTATKSNCNGFLRNVLPSIFGVLSVLVELVSFKRVDQMLQTIFVFELV